MTMYQLRRLRVNQDPQAMLPDDTVLLFQTTKIGRNPDLVDVVLISSVHSNMISRVHTVINVRNKRDRYACFIHDESLNGTYVNDYRVTGDLELQQGDVIKFGHVNGAAIKPGCYGPQTSAEFTFVFEEAPPQRLGDRRRPLTIYGSTRPQETLSFPSQMFVGDGKNLHAASRLPLTNPSVEFATSWQNPAAAGAAAAAAPFYNLQRFPGYYQAAFPQLNPAYLQSLWPQNPWPSPTPTAAAHQFQQQQLQQKEQVQAQAVAATAAAMFLQQYGQLNSAWMGASAQIAADTASLIGAAGDNRLRTMGSEQTSQPRIPSTATAAAAAAAVAAAAVTCSQRPVAAATSVTSGHQASAPGQSISTQNSSHLLQSFVQRTSATTPAALVSNSIPITRNSGAAAAAAVAHQQQQQQRQQQQYSVSSRTTEQRISRLAAECSPAQVVATPSAIDSVKRMECDSSVPSPPKTQQQQQAAAAAAAAAAMFGTVPTGIVGIHRTAAAGAASASSAAATTVQQPHSVQKSSIATAAAAVHVQAQTQAPPPPSAAAVSLATVTTPAAVAERRFNGDRLITTTTATTVSNNSFIVAASIVPTTSAAAAPVVGTAAAASAAVPRVSVSSALLTNGPTSAVPVEKPMEELQRENAERNSRMSGLEELTEDLLEDCGPPRRAISPTPSSSAEMGSAAIAAEQEQSTTREETKVEQQKQEQQKEKSPALRSPPHQSPRRRGHGHSDSSRSPTRTPVAVVEQKAEPKKRRKNNEVAMLLNDLTEVAWQHLARKSTNKITPTQTRKLYTAEAESSGSESDDSEKSKKKAQPKKTTKPKSNPATKSVTFSKSNDSGKGAAERKRGRPKKNSSGENVGNANSGKKKTLKRKKSSSSSSSSNQSGNSSDSGSEQQQQQQIKKDVKKTLPLPKDQPGTSAAEKIERALDMMRKRRTFPDSDDESETSSFSSSSSPSPIRRTWGATSQRKTGSASGSSNKSKKKAAGGGGKAGRQSRPVNKIPRKGITSAPITTTTTTITATTSANASKKGRKKKNRSSSSESESTSEASSVEWDKVKPVVTPLPAANAPLVFDEWTYHDPEKQCDARSGCKKPQSENVDWVQCDYCNRWYHMECVADRGVTVDNADDFDCGCREANKTT